MFKLRQSPRTGLQLALVVVAFAAAAWGQASSSVEQQFAAYHQQLSGAADGLLVAPAQRSEEQEQEVVAAAAPVNANERFSSAVARVQQLRPLLEPILREEGVPMDVAAVVLVESGGRATALSAKGALGLWQLMPQTARRYGLMVSSGRDERLDASKATRAAVRYLRDLYTQFGDWRLAFAAYNAGEQAVQRAIARTGSNDFQHVNFALPNETRAYVPAVIAARPLFGAVYNATPATLRAARVAQVLYASAKRDN